MRQQSMQRKHFPICYWPRRHTFFNFRVVTAGSVSTQTSVEWRRSPSRKVFSEKHIRRGRNCFSCFTDEGRALPCTAEHWSPLKCCDYECELWSVRMGERLFSFVITLNRLKHKKTHFYSNLICTSLNWVVHAQVTANPPKPPSEPSPERSKQFCQLFVFSLAVIVCWDRQQHTKSLPPGVVHSFRA